MTRDLTLKSKPDRDNRTTMARGLVLMLLFSTLLQMFAGLTLPEQGNANPKQNLGQSDEVMTVSSPTNDPGNTDAGGYHLSSGEWWEGKLDFIPSSDDQDGDGVTDSNDSHPWNRNLNDPLFNCSAGCLDAPDLNIELPAIYPEWTEDAAFDSISTSALGDMDGDGDLDMMAITPYNLHFIENENGEFNEPEKLSWTSYSNTYYTMNLIDLDADGDLDVIMTGYQHVAFVEMNGTAVVRHEFFINCVACGGKQFLAIDFGDVNGDGLVDFLIGSESVSSSGGAGARLYVNTYSEANGISFNLEWQYNSTANNRAFATALNDYDGDGDADIFISTKNKTGVPCVSGSSSCYAVIGFNVDDNRANIVNETPDFMLEPSPTKIFTAMVGGDLNHDGYNELVLADQGGGVYVVWNQFTESGVAGYGSFEDDNYSYVLSSGNSVFYSKSNLGLADFNNDGLLDIYSGTTSSASNIGILIADGLGNAGGSIEYNLALSESSSGQWTLVSVGDIDANGFSDIVLTPFQSTLSYYRMGGATLDGSTSRTFTQLTGSNYGIPVGLAVDFDGDGNEDLLLAGQQNVSVFKNNLGLSAEPVFYIDQYYATSLATGDINDDGYPELMTAGYSNGISLRWGSENGWNESADETFTPESKRFGNLHVVDIDGDGWLDFTADSYSASNSRAIHGYVYTYDGDGGFNQFWKSDEVNSTTGNLVKVIIKDVDKDGIEDYVRCMGFKVHIYNGTDDGAERNFSSTPLDLADVSSSWTIRDCALNDFDKDGNLDLLVSRYGAWYFHFGPLDSQVTVDVTQWISGEQGFVITDLNFDGILDLLTPTSASKKTQVISYDGTSFTSIWEGGDYKNSKDLLFADFDSDGIRDMILLNYLSQPQLILGVSDMDSDGVADSDDDFSNDPTQSNDYDGDGFGDSGNGYLPDGCIYYWGDSTEDRRGCPDQDSDGWSDLNDDFWRDSNQWIDTDNDGYGDNYPAASATGRPAHWPGEVCPVSNKPCNYDSYPLDWDDDGYEDSTLNPQGAIGPYDNCPFEQGSSSEGDTYGCLDSDIDGWANVIDAYPTQNSQHNDSDNDGFGDNESGWFGDHCPDVWGQSIVDYYGCVDADSDGWSELTDLDDNDPNEQEDTDNDSIGDNGDQCPYQWSNLTIGPDRGCPDTDADSRADRSDAFPYDPTQWFDGDNDGYGDNESGNQADAFPGEPSQWADSDGDGRGDNAEGNNADAFPNDATQWSDFDGDGYGDNVSGNDPDAFSNDGTQWSDRDSDGFGDNADGNNADAFPYDASQWSDKDGDGYGDQNGGNESDKCKDDAGSSRQRLGSDGSSIEWYGCPDADFDLIPDDFDQCSNTAGTSYIDRIGCPDSDDDAVSDMNDPYPYVYSDGARGGDWDNDSYADERPSFMMTGLDVFPDDSTQWGDQDGDGYGDNSDGNDADWAPEDETQHADSDGDGYGDNSEGTNGDACPNEYGDSNDASTGLGCPDTDGDGVRDSMDDFRDDPSQSNDRDGDGWGDDAEGWDSDAFPDDSTQWKDSDGDGFGDNPDGNDSDAFPYDSSQHSDIDGDGYGDDMAGTDADNCPMIYGTSSKDRLGCVDSDDDGYSDQGDQCPNLPGWSDAPYQGCPDRDEDGFADVVDAFPDDDSENQDSDGDGIGDNSDLCFSAEMNETIDCTDDADNDGFNDSTDVFPDDDSEWKDSDGDGYGDNADLWPTQKEIWSDADGDGWADQFGHILTDDCPSIPGNSSKFMHGCSDIDEDGMPDILDPDIDGDGITNDNEMDASTSLIEYDPFDATSSPPDMDGDGIPDVLDADTDGDGFPNDLEAERKSNPNDGNETPFNLYGEQSTGLYYIPGEGFKSQYDPNGVEISVSVVLEMVTSEFLIPLMMIPLTIFALLRKGRRYKRMRKTLENCDDGDVMNEYEEDIDTLIMKKKVKVEHGMLLRNLFERKRDMFADKKATPAIPSAGGQDRGESGRDQNDGPSGPINRVQGPSQRPGHNRPGQQGGRQW